MTPETRRLQTFCLLVIATGCLGGMLYFLKGVLVPFTLAMFLTLAISPTVDFQVTRMRIPRGMAVLVSLAVSALLLVLVGTIVATSATQLLANVDAYEARFQELLWAGLDTIPDELGERLDVGQLLQVSTATLNAGLNALTDGFVYLLSQFTVVFLFVLFLLLGDKEGKKEGLMGVVEERTQRYIIAKTAISALTAVLVGVVLKLAGVELATVFGLLTFILNFIPNVGSLVATVLPIPVLLFSPTLTFYSAILVLCIIGVIQFVVGNIIEPKVLGETLDLDPIVVLLALLVWGALWGAVGMVLALPITAVIKFLLEQVDEGRALAQAMSQKPKPRPAQVLESPEE